MSTTETARLVEVPDELRETLLRVSREQFTYEAETAHAPESTEPGDRIDLIERIRDNLTRHHDVCAALESGEVGHGMFPADAVRTAAAWALDDVESRFRHDSGWTIDEASNVAAEGRALRALIETCER